MSALSDSAEAHIEQLRELQALLSDRGAAVLEHSYVLLLMGSFSLVVGNAHQRLKFDWDGREFFLNVQSCRPHSRSATQEWAQTDNAWIPPPQSIWASIRNYCTPVFDT